MWRFQNRESGHEWVIDLKLYWEVEGDPISDDYSPDDPDDPDAVGLFHRWADRYGDRVYKEELGSGWLPILWSVTGVGSGVFEFAPFGDLHMPQADRWGFDFLTHFTWPVDDQTGERLQWTRLPVVDKLWRSGDATKGGFIQEATGWKPAPYQPYVYLPALRRAAGL